VSPERSSYFLVLTPPHFKHNSHVKLQEHSYVVTVSLGCNTLLVIRTWEWGR